MGRSEPRLFFRWAEARLGLLAGVGGSSDDGAGGSSGVGAPCGSDGVLAVVAVDEWFAVAELVGLTLKIHVS